MSNKGMGYRIFDPPLFAAGCQYFRLPHSRDFVAGIGATKFNAELSFGVLIFPCTSSKRKGLNSFFTNLVHLKAHVQLQVGSLGLRV